MDEKRRDNIEYNLADVIIGRPHGFTVGHKHFYLYPLTLAKIFLLKRHVDQLDVNNEHLKQNAFLEALRVVKANKGTCCNILAIHTAPNTQKDLFSTRNITIRKNIFASELTDEEISSLMIYVLTEDRTEEYMRHLGLDKEKEKMHAVMKIKQETNNNSISFNGKSIFGTFIGQLKEMGYTDNEILYEKGYTYLSLMLADKVVTMHLTDEERSQIPEQMGGSYIDASDPSNAGKIFAALKNRGVQSQAGK